MIRRFKQFFLAACIVIALTGCHGQSSTAPANIVNASVPQNTYVVATGNSVIVPVTFTANTGDVTQLSVTNLSDLPDSWSVQNGGSAFSCATVSSTGTGCQIQLVFAPNQRNLDNGTLNLNYTYVNSAGQNKTGQIDIAYSVLNTVITSMNPTPPIKTVINSTQNVFVTFSARPSATTATDLQVTSDLAQLPSGWSVPGGATPFFNCATVQGMNACELGLSFQPTSTNQSGTLQLNYSYRDNTGTVQQSMIYIPYAVTTHNTVQGTTIPANVSVAVGSSAPVTVDYTTSDGLPATDFQITSGLAGLNNLGWNGPSSFNCSLVTGSNGCLLQLHFVPTNYNQDGTLNLRYSYKDNSGVLQIGSTNINYSATTINTVQTSTSPSSPVNVYVGQSIPVTLTFTTSDGRTATNFNVINGLNPLPAGWTQINGIPGAFSCPSVNIGTACQLVLQFSPHAAVSSGTLTLGYSYVDNSGNSKDDTANLSYSATSENNVQFSASPSAPLTLAANSTQAVTVDFTTDSGSVSNFTMDLSQLTTSNPGWSSSSGSTLNCGNVNNTVGTCKLNLTYAPTTMQSSILSLPYSYTANDGNSKTGTFTYAYTTGTDNNTVNAVANPASLTGTRIGNSASVTVNFNTSDSNSASNLFINLSQLPAGWNASASSLNCAIIPSASGGTSCSLTLSYAPDTLTSNTTLTLPYTYTANDGERGNETLSIPYSATPPLFAYLISTGLVPMLKCPVNNDGTFGTCDTAGSDFVLPRDIAFKTLNSGTFAYISSRGNTINNNISKCPVNGDGTFGTCATIGNGFNYPYAIAFETMNGGTFAYVSNYINNTISKCPVNSDGTFGTCVATGNGFNAPIGLVFETLNSGTFAYVTNGNVLTLSKCPVNNDGTFGTCVAAGNGFGIAFETLNSGTFAYVTNGNDSTLSKCPVNSDGTFGTCVATGNFISALTEIAIETQNSGTFAYVTNTSSNSSASVVSKCPVNSDGTFGTCVSLITTDGISAASSIAFQTAPLS